jgi:hypothetical protein
MDPPDEEGRLASQRLSRPEGGVFLIVLSPVLNDQAKEKNEMKKKTGNSDSPK